LLAQLPPDEAAEGEAEAYVAGRKPEAFLDADFTILAVEDAEIEREQRDDDAEDCEPQSQRLAKPIDVEKFYFLPSVSEQRRVSADRNLRFRHRRERQHSQRGPEWAAR